MTYIDTSGTLLAPSPKYEASREGLKFLFIVESNLHLLLFLREYILLSSFSLYNASERRMLKAPLLNSSGLYISGLQDRGALDMFENMFENYMDVCMYIFRTRKCEHFLQ